MITTCPHCNKSADPELNHHDWQRSLNGTWVHLPCADPERAKTIILLSDILQDHLQAHPNGVPYNELVEHVLSAHSWPEDAARTLHHYLDALIKTGRITEENGVVSLGTHP